MEPTLDESLLAAYLDGELAPQERQRLEQRLADEPELRQRLTLLEDAWHCLDLLEQESADAEKIETTLKTVAISVSAAPFHSFGISRWGQYRWAQWSIAVLTALALFVFTFQLGKRTPGEHNHADEVGIEESKQLAETLEKLSPWEKDDLLNEKPKVILYELKQLWNTH